LHMQMQQRQILNHASSSSSSSTSASKQALIDEDFSEINASAEDATEAAAEVVDEGEELVAALVDINEDDVDWES